jgi:hypothetical protein
MSNVLSSTGTMVPDRQILPKSPALRRKIRRAQYANDFSALNPTLWAREAILRLRPRLVMGNLVGRDWEDIPRKFGDVVNAFMPGDFTFSRKGAPCENVVTQSTNGTTVQVALDQWPQIAFQICDGDEDREFLDLVDTLLNPAIVALAEGADRILATQVHQFYGNNAGQLGTISNANVLDYLTDATELFSINAVPMEGRAMVITPKTNTAVLKNSNLINAAFTGDEGTALRTASVGQLVGWNLINGLTQPSIRPGQTTTTALVNMAGGAAAGATAITYDTELPGADPFNVGQWVVIAGDGIPQHITAIDTAGNILTITPGLKRAAADNALITGIKSAAVNNAAGYIGTTASPHVIGYNKQILIDGIANSAPKIGQMVTFGINPAAADFANIYAIIRVDTINAGAGTFGIWLDKPLVSALVDNEVVNFGPAGEYNFGIMQNAFALVSRPLPKPRVGTLSSVASYQKFSIRVTISYDAVAQAHLVVVDFLMGVGKVNDNLGMVMFG